MIGKDVICEILTAETLGDDFGVLKELVVQINSGPLAGQVFTIDGCAAGTVEASEDKPTLFATPI